MDGRMEMRGIGPCRDAGGEERSDDGQMREVVVMAQRHLQNEVWAMSCFAKRRL